MRALGQCQYGSSFVLDVFDAYRAGLVSNPNVIVAGSIGAGKSTVVKMQLERALRRGRRAVVVDPKGEYGELAVRHGVRPIALGRDGWCSPFPADEREGRHLLRALVASAQGFALSSEQHFALDEVWQRLESRPTRVLFTLYQLLASHLESTTPSAERALALVLHRFIYGDLAGLFDGPGEPVRFIRGPGSGRSVVPVVIELFGGRGVERGGGGSERGRGSGVSGLPGYRRSVGALE